MAAIVFAVMSAPAPSRAQSSAAAPVLNSPAIMGFAPYIQWPKDLDPGRFFPVSKVRPKMKGIGKTVFEGTQLEEFTFEVLGVAHNFFADSDVIWIRIQSDRLKDLGVVAGMSGSPVYIDGKMLGAVAYGYSFTREPIAGITPIEQMIRVLSLTNEKPHPAETAAIASNWENAKAVFGERRAQSRLRLTPADARQAGLPGSDGIPADGAVLEPLAMPLFISSAHPFVCEQAQKLFSPYGFTVIPSGGAGRMGGGGGGGLQASAHQSSNASSGTSSSSSSNASSDTPKSSSQSSKPDRAYVNNHEIYPEKPSLVDGAALGVTLMRGDIDFSGIGTVTLVHGDKLVAFGHPMFGDGAVDFPMTSAVIFGVMPSIMRPFKIGEPYEEIGSIRQDRMPAIGGSMKHRTPTMPMTVKIHSVETGENREFHYEIVPERFYGPMLAFIGWLESVMSADRGGGPATVESRLVVRLGGGRTLERTNLMSGDSYPLFMVGYPLMMMLGDLFNNPYQCVKVEGIEIETTIRQRLDMGVILQAKLDRDRYLPGETAKILLEIQRWRGAISHVEIPVEIPADLEDGSYRLSMMDGQDREYFEYQLRPYLANALDLRRMIDQMQVSYPSNALYAVLTRPEPGLAINDKPMPAMPSSVLSAMRDSAPSYQTTSLSTSVLREVRQPFDYEIGGSRTFMVQVSRKIPK